MKKTLSYFMHVPWGWIKQRPHFLAEHLTPHFDVRVYYLHTLFKPFKGVDNDSKPVDLHKLFVTPFRHVNDVTIPFQLNRGMKKSKYVWVTHPLLMRFVMPNLTNDHIVIYDCMDDVVEFPRESSDPALSVKIAEMERCLCERADVVLATSEHLKNKLIARYGLRKSIPVVNNGIHLYGHLESRIEDLAPNIRNALSSSRVKLVYIGTVGEWMDFSLIIESLKRFNNIEYIILGHNEVEIPSHDRIKFFGPVKHDQVFSIMANSDILIMPFILNELVLSVNPVKVYEYIHSCKPSLVRRYPETEKFADYVHLYSTADEFCSRLGEVINSGLKGKATPSACNEYVRNNTWDVRAKQIVSKMAEVA